MKKSVLFVILIVIAMTLISAVPSAAASSAVSNSAGQPICIDQTGKLIKCPQTIGTNRAYKIKIPGQGEPTMEKVSYFNYMVGSSKLGKWLWNRNYKFYFYGKYGCLKWYWWVGTYKIPVGCNFRYQY